MNQHEDLQNSPGEPLSRPAATASARARESYERSMRWAADNLRCADARALEARGVNVYFASNIKRGVKVVNLADGRIDQFREDEHLPESGYYAEYASLEAYCRAWSVPMQEVDGTVVVLSSTASGDRMPHPRPRE